MVININNILWSCTRGHTAAICSQKFLLFTRENTILNQPIYDNIEARRATTYTRAIFEEELGNLALGDYLTISSIWFFNNRKTFSTRAHTATII